MRIKLYILTFVTLSMHLFAASMLDKYDFRDIATIPTKISVFLNVMPQDLQPTLDAPELQLEPEYTLGTYNTVYWESTPIQENLISQNYTLLFFEIRIQYNDTERWLFTDVDVDTATFHSLPEGIPIIYQLRYYAEHEDGTYAISEWSQSEQSIQDVDPPVLQREHSYVMNTRQAGDQKWVFDNTIQIQIIASDSIAGKVSQVIIEEKSNSGLQQIAYDFPIPSVYVHDTILMYLESSPREAIELTWWLYDVAGQKSATQTETIYLWPEGEEAPEDVVCFPNPFYPEQGEVSKIKIALPDITEAKVYDLFGNHIQTLTKSSDHPFFEWNGKNEREEFVAKGGYFCVIQGKKDIYCKIAVIK